MSERDTDGASAADEEAANARGSEEPQEEGPLADRRPGDQGARPSPDEEIAGEREPSPTDPASYDPDQQGGNEPPEYPTRA